MRHIEKLKQIFTCCGKSCNSDSNGKAIDNLFTLAKNGELGSGGGGNVIPSTGFGVGEVDVKWKPLYLDGKIIGFDNKYGGKCTIVYDGQTFNKILNEEYSDTIYREFTVADFKMRFYYNYLLSRYYCALFIDETSSFDISKLESITFTWND